MSRIRELRRMMGMTQKQLGEALRVTTRCIQYWESEQRRPPHSAVQLLESIARGLGLDDRPLSALMDEPEPVKIARGRKAGTPNRPHENY